MSGCANRASRWNLTADDGSRAAVQFLPLSATACAIWGGHIRVPPSSVRSSVEMPDLFDNFDCEPRRADRAPGRRRAGEEVS
jgi:hypothetical protein